MAQPVKILLGPKSAAAAEAVLSIADSHNRLAKAMESIAASLEKIANPPVLVTSELGVFEPLTPWSDPEHDIQADLNEAAEKIRDEG